MKKPNKNFVYAAVATVATVVASLVATSACFFWIYQPEEPDSLKDE